MNITIDDATFRAKLKQYAEATGKALGEVVLEQAKLLAKRLSDLTIPKSKSEGNKSVAVDIGKVYLRNQWFENTFAFTNTKLGERVKNLVIEKNENDLTAIFQHSGKLNTLRIEPFDASRHKSARKAGRVNYKKPFSFPLQQQAKVKQYTKAKQKNVGMAKAGWAYCYKLLGGTPASWLSQARGEITDNHNAASNPSITLTNNVKYFSAINSRLNIVSTALAGRSRDMMKAAQHALNKAKREAGF